MLLSAYGLGHAGKERIKCIPGHWRCSDNLKCVSESSRCNGIYDCQDHSDESNCDESLPPESLKGKFRLIGKLPPFYGSHHKAVP